jgi:hypothetical protein
MNSTPVPDAPSLDPSDPVLRQLASAVSLAREAAEEVAGPHEVGAHVGYALEDDAACTHLFDADTPGYRGWRWAVTVASAGVDYDVTVSEVVLLPGPDALTAPEWVPWQERVQAGDLGVGDLMPTAPDDPRLVPGYLASDDAAVEDTAMELGLGRVRVMGRAARLDAASRWRGGEFGPRSDMARGAPGHCVTCGFYLPLAGSLSAAFGVCGNEIAPADGHLVHVEYGCGAHSEAEVEQVSPVLVADLIYDDNAMLDIEVITYAPEAAAVEAPSAEPEVAAESVAVEALVEPEVEVEVPQDVAVAEAPAEVPQDLVVAEESAESAMVEPPSVAPDAEPEVAAEPAAVEAPLVELEVEPEVPQDLVVAEVPAESATLEAPPVEPEVAAAPAAVEAPLAEPEVEAEAPQDVAAPPNPAQEQRWESRPPASGSVAEEQPAEERAPGGAGQPG